jgi:hypothetical protein
MTYYKVSKRLYILFFAVLFVALLLVPISLSRSASSVLSPTRTINPLSSEPEATSDNIITAKQGQPLPLIMTEINLNNRAENYNDTSYVTGIQNTTLSTYYKTIDEPVVGFSNMTCYSGFDYVEMTGQYTAGNTSYKVIFLRMALLDDIGNVIAIGTGHVYGVDAHKTTTFNAITRYDSTFSSCTIQIDSAIPK